MAASTTIGPTERRRRAKYPARYQASMISRINIVGIAVVIVLRSPRMSAMTAEIPSEMLTMILAGRRDPVAES